MDMEEDYVGGFEEFERCINGCEVAWLWRPVGVSRWSLVKRKGRAEDVRTRCADMLFASVRDGNESVLRMFFCSPIRRSIPPKSYLSAAVLFGGL